MSDRLTHVDDTGAARMVDVSGKDVTARTATASGRVLVSEQVVALLRGLELGLHQPQRLARGEDCFSGLHAGLVVSAGLYSRA